MILELLLLIVLLFFVTLGGHCLPPTTLPELQRQGELILQHARVEPRPHFQVRVTRDVPRTEHGKDIYLVLTRPDGTLYDSNTLIGVLCHELAHIISGAGDEHGENFEMWETDLLRAAHELGWYEEQLGIDESYPCFHET